ncbi:bifunctional diaminohydroxyphosphoribosylaminopyrimidine deaminase/5-amino-6-(5-phosphoribosylamino)uracil reductase RibD [Flavobacterium sp. '19STA2R22 D10 B1']|uniref:bifunctional diaminohydroxyphosphoribosylaminopyrimidine deaminase/5-amino-6-(5-phosphoribosylamino)uracil reductase RibD n=1 Tax=Flavobacterium aerium TaxID=3037261 RepID=UPI00278BBCC4|nr:bifunctional diaminohydroxyphosphoribosylaminopyrimidine deaminase/5-amino-6-(5-phosphoribosylamino)uracil reductase RibD [Flavobacterium sp. '19STA2R22 D10 B1']
MKIQEKYIKRCIQLAKNGLGTTYTNPLVGSVIVHNNIIIGEGWHQKAGEAHAEVNAVNSVVNKDLLKESTIYVSLEPCSHFGKTPPCCDLIIQQQIPNIVVGTIDTFAKVAGNGIKRLKEAGRNVTVGILEEECRALNQRFFTFHQEKRPFIILKWAESKDGFIGPAHKDEKRPVWITNPYSRQLVHKWRSEEQAIVVGTNTVIDDNPILNVRDWTGNNPIRIVIDRHLRIPKDHAVYNGVIKTIFITAQKTASNNPLLQYEVIDFDKNIAQQIVTILYENEIQSVIIEGGKQTLQTFIDQNLWDEARIFKGTNLLHNGTLAPILKGIPVEKMAIINDELLIYKNHDKHNYF